MKQSIQDKYQFEHIIGKGNFGTIFKIKDKSAQRYYACKMEKNTPSQTLLKKEYDILKQLQFTNQFPKAVQYWRDEDNSYLVMELLGDNLQKKKVQRGRLGMRTVALIGKEMLAALQTLHQYGYLHRDMKPENILVGFQHQVYLIDFGLTKRSYNSIPPKTRNIIGNVRYASRSAHLGDSSKLGDIESLSYILVYLFVGYLPWQKLPASQIHQEINRINSYQEQPVMTPLLRVKYQINASMFPQYELVQKLFFAQLLSLVDFIHKSDKLSVPKYKEIYKFIDRLLLISDGFSNKCFDWCSQCGLNKQGSIDELWNLV